MSYTLYDGLYFSKKRHMLRRRLQ